MTSHDERSAGDPLDHPDVDEASENHADTQAHECKAGLLEVEAMFPLKDKWPRFKGKIQNS